MQGVLWAAAAGVSFGLFQAVNRRASRDADNFRATFVLLVVSAALLGAVSLGTQRLELLVTAPPSAFGWFALAGVFHFVLGWTFLGFSQRRVGAGRAGVLVGTTPLFGTAAAFVILGEVVRASALVGVALVVVGILLLSLSQVGGSLGGLPDLRQGLAFGLVTALCWGLSPVFIRWGLEQLPAPLLGVTVGMAACTAVYGLGLLLRGRPPAASAPAWSGWQVLAGVLVGCGIAGQWIALEQAPVAVVLALNQLAVPVVLLVAPLVVGGHVETLNARTAAGALLVLSGTLLVISGRAGTV